MLQNFRDQKNNVLIVVLFGIIILVFVFVFGLPSARDSCVSHNQSTLAKVNDHTIKADIVRTMVMRVYSDNVFGTEKHPEAFYRVTNGIAMIYLLADEARKAGLRVSDEELSDYIQNWEAGNPDVLQLGFFRKGKFSQKNYNNALANYGISSSGYEDYKREELLAKRYLQLMESSISVSDEELWQDYALANDTASLEIVRLTPDAINATMKPLADDEVTAFESSADTDIKTYYDEHIADYTTPANAQLQQIVVQRDFAKLTNPGAKTVKTYTPEDRFAAIVKGFENGEAFDQVFDDFDESDNKEKKGLSNSVNIDNMPAEFQAAMEGKKVGDTFTATLSDRYVYAKIVEKNDEVIQPLDAVKHEIALKLLNDRRIKARMDEVSKFIIAAAKEGKSFEEVQEFTDLPTQRIEQLAKDNLR